MDAVSRPVWSLPYRSPHLSVTARRVGGGRGPELVTNGTFDANLTGWTAFNTGTGTSAWSAGTLNCTGTDGTTNRGGQTQTLACVAGVTYEVTFLCTVNSGGGALMVGTAAGGATQLSMSITSGSPRAGTFVATQASHVLTLRNSGTGGNVNFDNVSVKAIL